MGRTCTREQTRNVRNELLANIQEHKNRNKYYTKKKQKRIRIRIKLHVRTCPIANQSLFSVIDVLEREIL